MPSILKKAKKPAYSPVLKLPPLPYEQFVALRDNIAVNGVLVPIPVDSDGPRRRIIDGNYRKAIADELGYDCPEIVHPNLTDEEMRTLARALSLTRRQLTQEQKRQLVADQLEESPGGSNRWIGKQLGVPFGLASACSPSFIRFLPVEPALSQRREAFCRQVAIGPITAERVAIKQAEADKKAKKTKAAENRRERPGSAGESETSRPSRAILRKGKHQGVTRCAVTPAPTTT